MAKNQSNMKSAKNVKKDIKKNVKEANATLIDFSEDIIKETVKTGEAWQKLMAKAIKNSEPLMKKQSDILFETVKGMKSEAEYGVKRFEKLTGFDFSDIRKTIDIKAPKAPKWIKEGFDYISDQAEDILTEVSKKGEEFAENIAKRGEELSDNISDTAKSFAKEAEEMKDKAEAKVIEVIKEVEDRITDVAPKAGAAVKKVTAILTDDQPLAKKVVKKKPVAKKTTAKKPAAKKAVIAKPVAKKATAKKAVAKKTTTTPKTATKKTATPKAKVATKKTETVKPAAGKKATTKAPKVDFKLIEGVGPKLEGLLLAAGYKTYADIANADVADLQKVLTDAGSRYKMHNPTSWPLQARFARDGKFDALKSWQEKNNAQKA